MSTTRPMLRVLRLAFGPLIRLAVIATLGLFLLSLLVGLLSRL